LPWQRPLKDRKTNFSLFTQSHISANSANLVRIGLVVDVEMIGLTESLEIKKEIKQRQNIKRPSAAGRANKLRISYFGKYGL